MRATAFALILFISSVAVAQTTRNVPAQFATIQAAIAASANGDTVLVAPGTYNENIDLTSKAIALMSSAGPTSTTIVGTGTGRTMILNDTAGMTTVSGFTITGGVGGVRVASSSLTLSNCIITGNSVVQDAGAGVRVWGNTAVVPMTVNIEDCVISNNSMTGYASIADNFAGGGGVLVQDMAGLQPINFTMRRCIVDSNVVNGQSVGVGGGGMAIARGGNTGGTVGVVAATVEDCVFENNIATSRGAGLSVLTGNTIQIRRCVFRNNTLTVTPSPSSSGNDGGAGIYIASSPSGISSTPIVSDCTICGNTVIPGAGNGGGVLLSFGAPRMVNCTITGNTAPAGGGMRLLSVGTSSPQVTSNCIIWGNSGGPQIDTTGSSLFAHPDFVTCDIDGPIPAMSSAIGCFSLDPIFANPAQGDYHLTAGSPCIDVGANSPIGGLGIIDCDGGQRIIGPTIDIGAFEFFGLLTNAAGNVGLGAGGPYDLLTVNASSGLPGRVVDVAIDAPLLLTVNQPTTNAAPSNFALVGFVGVPGRDQSTVLPNGIGTLCIPTGYAIVDYPGAFVITNNYFADPNQLASSNSAPWAAAFSGLPFPIRFTLQAVIDETPGMARVSNAVLINVE